MLLSFGIALILGAAPGTSSTPTPALPGPPTPTETIKPFTKPGQTIKKPGKSSMEKLKEKEKKLSEEQVAPTELYRFPGVVKLSEGKWVGYDYLYNLTNNIPIIVTIVKPENASIPVSEDVIKQRITEMFQKGGIDTNLQIMFGRPPSAVFNMIILIYPLNDGYIALCDGRLLESIDLKRVTLDQATEGTFQAVTWEHKNLIVSAAPNFVALLDQTVDGIVKTFLERYDFFKNLKKPGEGGLIR